MLNKLMTARSGNDRYFQIRDLTRKLAGDTMNSI